MSSDSGVSRNAATRIRTPNRGEKRTYDFLRRESHGMGLFRCRQTGNLVEREVTIRNPSRNAMGFYR